METKALSSTNFRVENAENHLKEGDLTQAIDIYQKLTKLHPNNAFFYNKLGQLKARNGKWREAIASYRRSLELGAVNPFWIYRNLGDALREVQQLDEAIDNYKQAIGLEPSQPEVYDSLGQAESLRGNYEKAIAAFNRAIALGIKNPFWTYQNLGDALSQENRFDEAKTAYEQARKLDDGGSLPSRKTAQPAPNPKWLEIHNKGDSYFSAEDWHEAIAYYRQALELNPDYFWSNYNLGRALAKVGKWHEAASTFEQSIAQDPNFAEAYGSLGQALGKLRRWDSAIDTLKQAIELDSEQPGWVYEALGDALSEQATPEELELLQQEERELIKQHPLPHKIFLPTEKIYIRDRVEGLRKVIDVYGKWQEVYQPQLKQLKQFKEQEKYKDKDRCFIIGNGPSLNLTALELLKDEVTFGVNGIFLKSQDTGFRPTFYVVEDHLVAEDRKEAINKFKGSTKLFPINLAYCFDEDEDTIFYDHRPRKSYPDGYDFSTDASECTYTGCTVTFSCMQLAYHLGFKNIYLIGVDCSYDIPEDVKVDKEYDTETLDMDSDDVNHFHPDYFGKGYRWHDPQVNKMRDAYREARRVCNETGINMYNATVGGKLEVFPRVDYYSLFDLNQVHPRVLIIDMTKIGSLSATGQIKKNLFAEWNQPNILQVHSLGQQDFGLYSLSEVVDLEDEPLSEEKAFRECLRFNPHIVYYRPVADKPHLHDFACQLIDALNIPVVTHIMDDWLERLNHQGDELYAKWDKSVRTLLRNSAARLSICQSMSDAFEERYGLDFTPIANCVEPEQWTNPVATGAPEPSSSLTIRYVGGLADDMNFQSISDLAKLVSEISSDRQLQLEIYTGSHWLPKAVEAFSNMPGVKVFESNFSQTEYQQLLASADVLVIAYNFDPESISYVRYSMANKLPECLASATPILVYGPEAVATVAYAQETEAVLSVRERDFKQLREAIVQLTDNPQLRSELGEKGRKYAFQYHSGKQIRHQLHTVLRSAIANYNADKERAILSEQMIVTEYDPNTTLWGKIKYLEQQSINLANYKKYLALGKQKLQQKHLDEAASLLQQAVEHKDDEYEVYFVLGDIASQQKQPELAKQYFKQSIELKDDYPWALRGLADSLNQEGEIDGAIEHYRKAVQVKPDYFYAQKRLASTYHKKGDLTQAIAIYRVALELKPDSSEVRQALNKCLAESGNV